jgi:hypothetical protein
LHRVEIVTVVMAQRQRLGYVVAGCMIRVTVHGRAQHPGPDDCLSHRDVSAQPAFDRKDSVGIGGGFLREPRKYAGIGRSAIGSVQERVTQLAVSDLVCQGEHGLGPRRDAAVQEAAERLQGFTDVG